MGDLGTFDGLSTSVTGEVLNDHGETIPGLYAVGNDRASIMGGNYPAAGITLGPIMTFGYITGLHAAGLVQTIDFEKSHQQSQQWLTQLARRGKVEVGHE